MNQPTNRPPIPFREIRELVRYLYRPMGDAYGKRTDALRARFSVPHDERVPLHVMKIGADLINDHKHLANDLYEQLAGTPVAIVLDTLNKSLVGSESKDVDMGKYIRAAESLRDKFQCVVIIVHHCGWDESRERGHSSLRGAVDAVLSAKREGMTVTITVEHMRDGPEGTQIVADAHKEDVGLDKRGRQATSLAIVPRDGEEGAALSGSAVEPKKNEWRGLGDFREALAEAILGYGFNHQIEAGAQVKAVDIEKVREEFYRRHVVVSAPTTTKEAHQEAKRAAFVRQFDRARARHLIGARSDLEGTHQFIWFASPLENWNAT